MQPQDLERITRLAVRELGIGDPPLSIVQDATADRWIVTIGGSQPLTLVIRAGRGTTAGHVREQIFNQFSGR